MGGFHSHNLYASRGDKAAVVRFLKNPLKEGALDDLWGRFDKDDSGSIERDELEELVFHILVAFWEEYFTDRDVPKKDSFRPVINKVVSDLLAEVDNDHNEEISRDEFALLGDYLNSEWQLVQQKKKKREMEMDRVRQQSSHNDLRLGSSSLLLEGAGTGTGSDSDSGSGSGSGSDSHHHH